MGFDIPAVLSNVGFILAIILAISIVFGYSPIYHLFGWSTRDKKDDVTPSMNGA